MGILVLGCALGSLGCVTTVIDGPDSQKAPPGRQAQTRRDLGIDHLARGRTAMAIRTLLEAESMNPDDHETHLWLGEAYRRKNMLDRAEAELLEALRLKPDFHATRINLTGLYIQMGRYEDAIRVSKALVQDPTFPTPWRALTNQGWAEYKLGRVQDARATLASALEFHPTFWPALLDMGIIENEQGNRLAALENFEQVMEQNPGPDVKAEVSYRMAEVFVAIGHRERAIRYFSDAIDSSPNGQWGKESKRYLKLLR